MSTTSRDLASNPSAYLFGRAIVIRDCQKNDHLGPFYIILDNFGQAYCSQKVGEFRQFWTGTTVQKDRQFQNPS